MANRLVDTVIGIMFVGLILLNAKGISSAILVTGNNYVTAVKGLQGRGLKSDMGR